MRHLWSLLAGIVAAPLAWLALATGQHRSEQAVAGWQAAGRFDTADLVGPVIFLVLAGVLLGLVGTLRWSPAGPLAAGVLLVIPTIFMFVNPFETLDGFSYNDTNRFLGQDLQLWRPVANGTLLVLGALLLVAVLSVQRWREWPALPVPARPATDEEVVAGVADLGGAAGPGAAGAAMSDDEILAAAAAADEAAASRTDSAAPSGETGTLPGTTGEPPGTTGEPPEPPAPGTGRDRSTDAG